MKIKPLLLSGLLFSGACQNEEQARINTLEKDVMAIHGAVMPKMGELVDLGNAISRQIVKTDSLLNITPQDTALQRLREQSIHLSSQLKKADDAMMDWMHNLPFKTA
ncbi:MAG: hypothetical protein U0X91_32390 [Spirosomataceae bacterium]